MAVSWSYRRGGYSTSILASSFQASRSASLMRPRCSSICNPPRACAHVIARTRRRLLGRQPLDRGASALQEERAAADRGRLWTEEVIAVEVAVVAASVRAVSRAVVAGGSGGWP